MFLIVFRNRKRPGIDEQAYAADAKRMEDLARLQPGFLSFKSYVAEDGEVIALSEWASEAAVHAWGAHPDHAAIQRRGQADYYQDYTLFSCDRPGVRPFDRRDRVSITLYGIPNCDTVKKARAWLDERGIGYAFHDYKKLGADPARLAEWTAAAGWEKVLNRAGTTFRKLPDADKAGLDEGKAIRLMEAHPSMIKRPIVEYPGGLLVGFKPDEWAAVLNG